MSNATAMDPTGERMVPENAHPLTFWEHVARYAFAVRYAGGRRVLDVACGEGYGSAALAAAGAAGVIGVDVSASACEHARQKYGLDARVGRAERLPIDTASIDLVVSFETLEHVAEPAAFLDECRRVLVPGGRVVISTPNRDVYGHRTGEQPNPYHCSEMSQAEFTAALGSRFTGLRLFGQRASDPAWFSRHTLSGDRTPWARFRGAERIRLTLQRWFEPTALAGATDAQRADVVGLIRQRSRRWDTLLDPYAVRPQPLASDPDRVAYLIAVAERPGDGER